MTQQDLLIRQIDEERLAYQVYTELGEHYPNLKQLQNIPRSESRHFDALKRYALAVYPELDIGELTGAFIEPETQLLYNQLIEAGKVSAQAALQVGVHIETMDIKDLDDALSKHPEPKLQTIYENLRAGSEKHLAAFSGQQGRGSKKGRLTK